MRLNAAIAVLLSASTGAMADEPFAGDAVYGTAAGCNWLETRTHPGTDDTLVVTRDYLRGYESTCHFVDSKPGVHDDLYVSAICYGEGEMWPTTYAMMTDPESDGLVIASDGGPISAEPLPVCEGATTALADEILGE